MMSGNDLVSGKTKKVWTNNTSGSAMSQPTLTILEPSWDGKFIGIDLIQLIALHYQLAHSGL